MIKSELNAFNDYIFSIVPWSAMHAVSATLPKNRDIQSEKGSSAYIRINWVLCSALGEWRYKYRVGNGVQTSESFREEEEREREREREKEKSATVLFLCRLELANFVLPWE